MTALSMFGAIAYAQQKDFKEIIQSVNKNTLTDNKQACTYQIEDFAINIVPNLKLTQPVKDISELNRSLLLAVEVLCSAAHAKEYQATPVLRKKENGIYLIRVELVKCVVKEYPLLVAI